jgi:hypothetical protein
MEVAEKSLHTKVPDISIFTKMSILRKEEEKGNLFMTKCKYRDAGIATVARAACMLDAPCRAKSGATLDQNLNDLPVQR